MSTATRVPETSVMRGAELSADDARTTLWRYGGWHLVRDSFVRFRYADGFTHARALGLQLCLSIIPLAIALVGLSATLHQTKAAQVLTLTLQHLTPGQGREAFDETLSAGMRRPADGGTLALYLGLVAALISLTTAMGQVERGANRIYGVERDRPSLQKYTMAFGNAVTAGIASLLGFVIIVAGKAFGDASARVYGWSDPTQAMWQVIRWPLGILLALVSITALLRHAPRRCQPGYSWLAVGAGLGLVLWLVVSLLLALYVDQSGSVGSTYGSITGVFVLLVWANLSSIALFFAVAFAAQLEAVRAGSPVPSFGDPERMMVRY